VTPYSLGIIFLDEFTKIG